MSKQKVYNKVQVKLAVAPPPPKTWQTPIYHLDHYTLRRHIRVVSIQLVGERGNEKRTESISLPLVSGITDSDYIRAAAWFSHNKWQTSFRMNVSQFGGTFSQPVDARLLHVLMNPSPAPSTQRQSHQELQAHDAPTMPNASFSQHQFRPPILQPGQFQQVPKNTLPPSVSPSNTRGSFNQWYHTRTRGVKVGLWSGALVVVLVFFSIVGTAIGSGNTSGVPVSSPTSQAAAPTSPPPTPVAYIQPTQPPPTQARATPIPTPMPTAKPTAIAVKPTPIPPTPTPCPGVNCNPWGYNFSSGNYITAPPSAFCSYFNCIASFWNGHGYVEECQDATYSLSGGIQGSCSHHGGDLRPLYAH